MSRRQGPATPPWVRCFRDEWRKLIPCSQSTGNELRVLLYMVMACSWGNWVDCTQHEIAAALELSDGQVSRTLARLVAHGYVLRYPPLRGRSWVYTIPSSLAHYGSDGDLGWKRPRDLLRQTKQRQHAKLVGFSLPSPPSTSTEPGC